MLHVKVLVNVTSESVKLMLPVKVLVNVTCESIS